MWSQDLTLNFKPSTQRTLQALRDDEINIAEAREELAARGCSYKTAHRLILEAIRIWP